MKHFFKICMCTILFLTLGGPIFAHHAMEYIEMESYSTARQGEFVFHLHFDYMVDDKNNPKLDHWEYTPGLSFGITNRLMFDIHTHYAKFGIDHIADSEKANFSGMAPSPFIEAVAMALQYRLTEGWPVNIAVAGVYEEPFSRSKSLLEGQRAFEGILIVSRDFKNHSNITMNLKYGKDGDETFTEWALGAKIPLTTESHGISAGVELLGDFDGDFSVLGGVYVPINSQNIIFKTGIQVGKNSEHQRVNVTLMYRF
jgi:hypothetical protein